MEGIINHHAHGIVNHFSNLVEEQPGKETKNRNPSCGVAKVNGVFMKHISRIVWQLSTGKELTEKQAEALLQFQVSVQKQLLLDVTRFKIYFSQGCSGSILSSL